MQGARMHHGWILAGKKGLGKAAFAMAAARELVAEPGVAQPDFHPDIVRLDHLPANDDEEKKRLDGKPYATKRNITIDQVRAMQHRLETRPTLGNRRAVIIDPADDLEKNAVNALLKSLEEPPAGTFFLLVSHRPGRLLATIRSRCRTLRFPALPDEQVATILRQAVPSADSATIAAATAAAEGSPGAALGFVEQDLASLHDIMLRIVAEGDEHFALRGALSSEIGARPDRERQMATLDLARAVVAAAVKGAPRPVQAGLIEVHAELSKLTGQVPTSNFDPGLLAMEIGGLLASARVPRETA
jgi:DNA polymerase-3 subunit delta'